MSTVLAVLSDIHATDARFRPDVVDQFRTRPPGKGSWLDYADATSPNPLEDFRQIVLRDARRADYLVVPGDIAHQANGDALRRAWSALDEIGQALEVKAVIATIGNHDVDSRYRSSPYDPSATLRTLVPFFPVANRNNQRDFWADGVACATFSDVRFVVVDSCRFHPNREAELDHGRISDPMLQEIRRRLEEDVSSTHNILVCHHHPHPFPMGREQADDRMFNGENLLHLLGVHDRPWLVVHGHRHVPRIGYAFGGATSPVVLAAGSVAAIIEPLYAPGVRNQAHFVSLEERAPAGIVLGGVVESWEFTPTAGWEPASSLVSRGSPRFSEIPSLPHQCGFGYRGSITELAQRIANALPERTQPTAWREITTRVPEVLFLVPENFVALTRELLAVHRLHLVPPGFDPREVVGE